MNVPDSVRVLVERFNGHESESVCCCDRCAFLQHYVLAMAASGAYAGGSQIGAMRTVAEKRKGLAEIEVHIEEQLALSRVHAKVIGIESSYVKR